MGCVLSCIVRAGCCNSNDISVMHIFIHTWILGVICTYIYTIYKGRFIFQTHVTRHSLLGIIYNRVRYFSQMQVSLSQFVSSFGLINLGKAFSTTCTSLNSAKHYHIRKTFTVSGYSIWFYLTLISRHHFSGSMFVISIGNILIDVCRRLLMIMKVSVKTPGRDVSIIVSHITNNMCYVCFSAGSLSIN